MKNKVLIVSYYWPPSGGAGVQRWLKLSRYLAELDTEVHVLTVDPKKASYPVTDETLLEDVHPKVNVHTTSSFEPLNFYARLIGKKNVPTSGFSNVNAQSAKQKAVAFIRSNLFIPDPRKGWKKYAVKKAVELIEQHQINHIITTSPPHSAQLIGLALKVKYGNQIRWVSDMRDPWTDIYYYHLLNHSKWSYKKDKAYERQVVEQSDAMITVAELFKESFISKSKKEVADKIHIVTNGFDPADFESITDVDHDQAFTVTYTGTMSDYYEPYTFINALARLIENHPSTSIKFRMVGSVSQKIRTFVAEKIGKNTEFLSLVTHHEAIRYMLRAHLLLLITQGEKGTIPGKTFEYLASRNPIICIGEGAAADIVEKSKAGKGFARNNEEAIYQYLEELLSQHLQGTLPQTDWKDIQEYSRLEQAKKVSDLVFKN